MCVVITHGWRFALRRHAYSLPSVSFIVCLFALFFVQFHLFFPYFFILFTVLYQFTNRNRVSPFRVYAFSDRYAFGHSRNHWTQIQLHDFLPMIVLQMGLNKHWRMVAQNIHTCMHNAHCNHNAAVNL